MNYTAPKITFSIKDLFSECDQIRTKLKKSLVENFTFCAVQQKKKKYIKAFCPIITGNKSLKLIQQ